MEQWLNYYWIICFEFIKETAVILSYWTLFCRDTAVSSTLHIQSHCHFKVSQSMYIITMSSFLCVTIEWPLRGLCSKDAFVFEQIKSKVWVVQVLFFQFFFIVQPFIILMHKVFLPFILSLLDCQANWQPRSFKSRESRKRVNLKVYKALLCEIKSFL